MDCLIPGSGITIEVRTMKNPKRYRRQYGVPIFILFLIITFVAILVLALLAPVIAPVDLAATDLPNRLKDPMFRDPASPHLFGTDDLGRDLAIRVLYGTRTTIMISFSAVWRRPLPKRGGFLTTPLKKAAMDILRVNSVTAH